MARMGHDDMRAALIYQCVTDDGWPQAECSCPQHQRARGEVKPRNKAAH
jgi:hypothetical protein